MCHRISVHIGIVIGQVFLSSFRLLIQKQNTIMRQIIFRGKCVQSGEWVEGDLIHGVNFKKDKMYILPLVKNLAYVKHCDPIDGVEILPETVSQFTGMVDKNKKQIFENDICLNGNDHHVLIGIGESIYSDDEGFYCKCYGVFVEHRNLKHPFIIGITTDFVSVVGNKFDNAELLSF